MQKLLLFVIAAVALAGPARADDSAQIGALEAEWSRAFLASDFDSLEQLIAPEFTLMRVEEGVADFTPRDRWFENARRFRFDRYVTRVVGSTITGDTAVLTLDGIWTISMGGQSRTEAFVVTDTWVRRNGRW